jgi:histidinol-phosphate aminotransferase
MTEPAILGRVRPHLLRLAGYEPVEPPEVIAERLGLAPEEVVKLDGNENPYGASERARQESAGAAYHIYPDPLQRRLRTALADYVGLAPEHIVAGAGSDELIDLLIRLFVAPGEAIIDFPPTFGMYSFLTEVADGRILNVSRRADFSIDVEGALTAAPGAKLIFAVSPNNPTGNLLAPEELSALLSTGLPVAVDEAYAEFSGKSYVGLIRRHENLLVLRTLSKWSGLAGLRVGYLVASPAIVEVLLRVKQPYNVNVAGEQAALASLDDRAALMERVAAIIEERERLSRLLGALEFLEVYPSQANFLLCRLVGLDATRVHESLRRRGILVRRYRTPHLENHLRISVGRPEQTDRLLAALEEIAASEPSRRAGASR